MLKAQCPHYLEAQFFPEVPRGGIVHGFRNENLEEQTFADESFDIVITQDVMEHVYNPAKAFSEICRTHKRGGAHIFTVPLINQNLPTVVWAKAGTDGKPVFLHSPEYHGNPVNSEGAPVATHWGYDIIDFIFKNTGMKTVIKNQYDLHYGICGEFRDVCISKK